MRTFERKELENCGAVLGSDTTILASRSLVPYRKSAQAVSAHQLFHNLGQQTPFFPMRSEQESVQQDPHDCGESTKCCFHLSFSWFHSHDRIADSRIPHTNAAVPSSCHLRPDVRIVDVLVLEKARKSRAYQAKRQHARAVRDHSTPPKK